MKPKQIFLGVIITMLLLSLLAFALVRNDSSYELKLKVDSKKKVYKLGEPIEFLFELQNQSPNEIVILDEFGVGTGFLQVEASKNGKDFIGCNHPGWGTIDPLFPKNQIQPDGILTASGVVLWDWLKQDVPKFRFSESGSYLIKAKYTVRIQGQETDINLESEPATVVIEEPLGEDLEVWSKIKNNGQFAYFIKEGDVRIPIHKTEERKDFVNKVEQILMDYPNSFYSSLLRQSLIRFRTNEANRVRIFR